MAPKKKPSSASKRSRSPGAAGSAQGQTRGTADNEHFPNLRARVSGSYGGHGKAALPGDMAQSGQSADFAAELENEVEAGPAASVAGSEPELPTPARQTRAQSAAASAVGGGAGPSTTMQTIMEESGAPASSKAAGKARAKAPGSRQGLSSKSSSSKRTVHEDKELRSFLTETALKNVVQGAGAFVPLAIHPDPDHASNHPPAVAVAAVGPAQKQASSTTQAKPVLRQLTKPNRLMVLLACVALFCLSATSACLWFGKTAYGEAIDSNFSCLRQPMSVARILGTTIYYYLMVVFDPEAMRAAQNLKLYEGRIRSLEKSGDSVNQAIQYIQRVLPDGLYVRQPFNGAMELTEEFWRAIKDKVEFDTQISTGEGAWKQFYANNEQMIGAIVQAQTTRKIQWHVDNGNILAYDRIEKMINAHARKLREEVQEKFSEAYRFAEIKEYAFKQAKIATAQTIEAAPAISAYLMASASLLTPIRLSLYEVNYASSSLGARVNPMLTSPTAKVPAYLWQRFVQAMFFRIPNPPVAALQPWTEPGQCWCTAPSKNNDPKAQLAIRLIADVHPTSFVLEHIPESGTLDKRAIPRDFELWVEVPHDDERARVRDALLPGIDRYNIEPNRPRRSWFSWLRTLGTVPKDILVGSDLTSMPEKYVRVLKGSYDRESKDFLQTFDIRSNVDFESINVSVKDVVVRFTSNGGAKHTCIYRVRIAGNRRTKPSIHDKEDGSARAEEVYYGSQGVIYSQAEHEFYRSQGVNREYDNGEYDT